MGLLISIPIVIWGSQLILKYVQRYPAIVYIGAGVLVWTGVKMMTTEPLIKPYFESIGRLVWVLYVVVTGGVLMAGFLKNRVQVRQRVEAHLVDLAAVPAAGEEIKPVAEAAAMKVLIPIDGSENSLRAVRHVVNRVLANARLEVHLLHVCTPFSRHVAQFVNRKNRDSYHRDMADRALSGARDLLNKHSVPHAVHIEFGDKAGIIDRVAQRLHIDQIVMGTARKNSLTRLIEDSVTNRVLEIARVPVEVIAGPSVSRLEKYGLPATLGIVLAAILVSVD
jgi:nucleotide-binding universal stress UspA family protein